MKCLVSENKKQRDRYIGKRFSLDNMVMEAARKQKLIEKPSSTGGLANAYFSFRVKLQPKIGDDHSSRKLVSLAHLRRRQLLFGLA
ncbi:hypothetical protein OUZ56_005371 [Daphnia magna]|uniref:Uncharacterized protein n=1 Tax=Daphnia magna TaxID=35525 RepID=A0ABQ9YSL7_9CRUS|nr:hypothetical protein OUZ56_005371 [Daphnia magna]